MFDVAVKNFNSTSVFTHLRVTLDTLVLIQEDLSSFFIVSTEMKHPEGSAGSDGLEKHKSQIARPDRSPMEIGDDVGTDQNLYGIGVQFGPFSMNQNRQSMRAGNQLLEMPSSVAEATNEVLTRERARMELGAPKLDVSIRESYDTRSC